MNGPSWSLASKSGIPKVFLKRANFSYSKYLLGQNTKKFLKSRNRFIGTCTYRLILITKKYMYIIVCVLLELGLLDKNRKYFQS